jgi:hypothetical protein
VQKASQPPRLGNRNDYDRQKQVRIVLEAAVVPALLVAGHAAKASRKSPETKEAGWTRTAAARHGALLCQIHGKTFQIRQHTVSKCILVSGPEHDTRRLVRFECFLPAWCTQAPTVTGFKARKAECGHWCGQIVAARFRESKKFGRHDHANRVTSHVLFASVATTVSIKAGHRRKRANVQRLPQDIACWKWFVPGLDAVVSKHGRRLSEVVGVRLSQLS